MIDADHLYAADYKWWKHHIADIANDFEGKCWSCDTPNPTNWPIKAKVPADPASWGIQALTCHISEPGLNREPGFVNSGGNSGYQAINLAYHLGASTIILLGFDMCCNSGKSHFFGDHPKGFNSDTRYERFISAYRTIKPKDYGLQILNCTRYTALDAFPRADLDQVFGKCAA